MSEKTKDWWEGKPTERGNLGDSRLTYEEEMTAKNQLERKGAYIDWKTGRIYAKEFIGDGQGLWNVGEGTGTGPRGEPGPQGPQGEKGDPGDPGADGKDYDPSALDDLQRQINSNTYQSQTNKEAIEGLESDINVNTIAIQRHEELIKGNTAKIATNSSDIFDLQQAVENIEIPEVNLEGYATEDYVDTAIESIEFPEPDLDGLVTKEEFDEHEKRNAASTVVLEAEILKVASEVVLNYQDIERNQKAITNHDGRITQLEEEIIGIEGNSGDIKGTQSWVNGTWDISNNVDANVKQCKVHTDRTAIVLNKDLIEQNDNNWENILAPYPSELGLEIDGTIYGLVVEYQGRAGQNSRSHNFRILSHNLPDNVANQSIVGIYPDFVATIGSKFITTEESKADDKVLQDQIDAIDIPNIDGLATEDYVKEEINKIDIPDVSDKASLKDDNEFNGKQEFNKNVTLKGVETTIQPQLSSRWHKFSVTPPKNADGTNNTSEAYGVEFYLDSGNTWKNQFKISNRNGVAFSVRGGEDINGQLHKEWKYSGPQAEDDHLATVKYVKGAVEGIEIPDVDLTGYATEDYVQEEINKIEIPEPDLSDYMTEEETVDFVDKMDKLTLVNAKLEAAALDQEYAVPLAGNSTKTGKLILKTNEATPFEIQASNGTAIFKMWNSGAVAMLKDYTEFKDNEFVTKKYVDDKVGSGGGSGFTQGDRVCATSAGATSVGGFYIENGNLYCKVT